MSNWNGSPCSASSGCPFPISVIPPPNGVHDAGPGGDLLSVETLGPDGLALSADSASPLAGSSVALRVRGGQGSALVAALSVGGVDLVPVLLLTGMPLAFVNGDASLAVAIPPALAGLDITLLAADVGPSLELLGVSNVATLAVR